MHFRSVGKKQSDVKKALIWKFLDGQSEFPKGWVKDESGVDYSGSSTRHEPGCPGVSGCICPPTAGAAAVQITQTEAAERWVERAEERGAGRCSDHPPPPSHTGASGCTPAPVSTVPGRGPAGAARLILIFIWRLIKFHWFNILRPQSGNLGATESACQPHTPPTKSRPLHFRSKVY